MALPRIARKGGTVLDTIEVDLARAAEDLAQVTAELELAHGRLAWADEQLGREAERADAAEHAAKLARAALAGGMAEAAALLLPVLPEGFYADDPMPAPGEPWAAVAGDTATLPALVPVRGELAGAA